MKLFLLSTLLASASAFAPTSSIRTSTHLRSDTAVEEVEAAPAFPTINGWTADPSKFCAGLPGALPPVGNFDPLGFTNDKSVEEIKRFREAEVTHGRVAMMATVGYLVGEQRAGAKRQQKHHTALAHTALAHTAHHTIPNISLASLLAPLQVRVSTLSSVVTSLALPTPTSPRLRRSHLSSSSVSRSLSACPRPPALSSAGYHLFRQ